MSRGVDIDVICAFPAPTPQQLRAICDETLARDEFGPLQSISELTLDALNEWHSPDERCIALGQPQDDCLLIYDSQFSHAILAEALAEELSKTTLLQVNVQEASDVTLRLMFDHCLFEYSNAPAYFNWGRCLGKSEPVQLARAEPEQFTKAVGRGDAARIAEHFKMIASQQKGERTRNGRYTGGVLDAVQSLAAELKLPRLYRFFEGWMKSDLDWDEDAVVDVFAYRKSTAGAGI